MRGPPIALELLHFLIGKTIRLEFAPRTETAGIAESQIAGFTDIALRRALVKTAGRNTEDLAGGDAIRLIAWIASSVKAPVAVELPFLAGNPGQNAALDRGKIGTDQHMSRRRNDHAAGAVADNGKRPRIQLAAHAHSRR